MAGGQQINSGQGQATPSTGDVAASGSAATSAAGSSSSAMLVGLRSRKVGGGAATHALSGLALSPLAGAFAVGPSKPLTGGVITASRGSVTGSRDKAATGSAITGSQGTATASGATGNQYTWFPSLDKNTIPWHVAAGAWGPRLLVQEASAPTGTTPVTVTTFADFRSAVLAGARTITIGADISGANGSIFGSHINGSWNDVDIIIPPGRILRSFAMGDGGGAGTTVNRMRFRGNTVGSHSGGQLHNVTLWGAHNDIIFDGIDITGPGVWDGDQVSAFNVSNTGNRIAVTRCRIAAGCYAFIGNGSNMIVTGCSVSASRQPRQASGFEGWGFRLTDAADGGVIFFGNHIRSTRYHKIRCHPTSTTGYLYIKDNWFWCIGRDEEVSAAVDNQLVAVDANLTDAMPKGWMAGMWFEGNEIWARGNGNSLKSGSTDSDGTNPVIAAWCPYVRSSGNTFHSESTAYANDASFVTTGSTDVLKSGNTYSAYATPTVWKSTTPGNPEGLNWDIGA